MREAAPPPRLGDFRIVRRLARGGMGEVYEARQEPLERRVAVKVMRRDRLSPDGQARFLREQKILARLHQTHIVPIHTAGEEGPWRYFVMPYIDGAALHHVVRRARRESFDSGRATPPLARLAEEKHSTAPDDSTLTAANRGPGPIGPPEAKPEDVPTGPAPPPRDRQTPRTVALSPEYFRSVAQAMADVADALDDAHRAGVLHRDLKPSNLMIDRAGHCWIIDFGLAVVARETPGEGAAPEPADPAAPPATGAVGTTPYMAPEQFEGRADVRSDVWGLGATMYELLTLQQPFSGPGLERFRRQIATEPPQRPRHFIRGLPRDLEAICLKGLSKAPQHRYASAGQFADDLRRWLRGEPTIARGWRAMRWLWLWPRLHKGWASFVASVVLLFVLVCMGLAAAARHRERAQRRETAMLQVENLRRGPREGGWSDAAQQQLRTAADIRRDKALQAQAGDVLAGLDARLVRQFEDFGAGHVAFDPEGERLLLSSIVNVERDREGARLWEPGTDRLRVLGPAAEGPVGFLPDGTPVQLSFSSDGAELVLTDLEKGQVRSRYAPPPAARVQPEAAVALTPDGSLAAAQATTPDGNAELLVWDGKTGAVLHRLPNGKAEFHTITDVSGKSTRRFVPNTSVLAFSPDGTLLAAGTEDGRITVHTLATGKPVASLGVGRTRIHCLAFARERRLPGFDEIPAGDGTDWLLAAGDAGGTVAIWDVGAGTPRAFCRGSNYDVYAVAFSPDGMTLASSGRWRARLWDVATGRHLLDLKSGDFMVALAFSPEGSKLAVGSTAAFEPGRVDVWQLQPGRGIRSLRGLKGQVSKAVFSRDGRRLAALSHDWRVAVWDLDSGHLLHVFDGPKGLVADNAALAFGPEGSRLAVSSGSAAALWELGPAAEPRRWELPPGLVDVLAFHASDKLLLFRVETQDGTVGPYGGASPELHPRVCRIRNLLAGNPTEPVCEITDFSRHVLTAAASPDGRSFVVDGLGGPDGRRRAIEVYGPDGALLGSIPTTNRDQMGWAAIDPTGKLAAVCPKDSTAVSLLTLPDCRAAGRLECLPHALGPGAKSWVCAHRASYGPSSRPDYQLALYRDGTDGPRALLGVDWLAGLAVTFGPGGGRLAWGTPDGTVLLADLAEVERRLTELGLFGPMPDAEEEAR